MCFVVWSLISYVFHCAVVVWGCESIVSLFEDSAIFLKNYGMAGRNDLWCKLVLAYCVRAEGVEGH